MDSTEARITQRAWDRIQRQSTAFQYTDALHAVEYGHRLALDLHHEKRREITNHLALLP